MLAMRQCMYTIAESCLKTQNSNWKNRSVVFNNTNVIQNRQQLSLSTEGYKRIGETFDDDELHG